MKKFHSMMIQSERPYELLTFMYQSRYYGQITLHQFWEHSMFSLKSGRIAGKGIVPKKKRARNFDFCKMLCYSQIVLIHWNISLNISTLIYLHNSIAFTQYIARKYTVSFFMFPFLLLQYSWRLIKSTWRRACRWWSG